MSQGCSVYVAAPKAYAKEVGTVAEELTRLGYPVLSTWHTRVLPDDSDVTDLEVLWLHNWRELQSADALLMLHYPGGRETYVEMGRCLALSKLIVIYQPGKEPLPLSHVASPRLVRVVLSLDRAYQLLKAHQPRRPGLYNFGKNER